MATDTAITISGHEYKVSSDIDSMLLHSAVEILNERIKMYKLRMNGDELRATVLAALSFALEQAAIAEDKEHLQETIDMTMERVEKLSQHLSQKLQEEEAFASLED